MQTTCPPEWRVPEEIRARLSHTAGRQRAMVADGHIVLLLHAVPAARQTTREAVLFWRQPDGEWKTNRGAEALPTIERLLAEYAETIRELEERHDAARDAASWFAVVEACGPISRAIANFYSTVQAGRKAIPNVEERAELQPACDISSELAREVELLGDDARNAVDFRLAQQSEIQQRISRELARSSQKLNFVAALFLPLTAIASVFGMNLPNGLQDSPRWVFWSVFVGGLAVGFLLSLTLRGRPMQLEDAPSLRGSETGATPRAIPRRPAPTRRDGRVQREKW